MAAQNTITTSSEFMVNFLQGQVMDPQDNFEALQTSTGLSLLFYQSSAGVLYVAQETTATSITGWTNNDLSTATIGASFPGQSNVQVKNFQVAEQPDGTIVIAMVVHNPNVNGNAGRDTLFLSAGNSSSNLAWISSPVWTAYSFDNPNVQNIENATLDVSGAFLGNGGDIVWVGESGPQTVWGLCIVVDVINSSNSISRFFIDPTKLNGYAWILHTLPAELTPCQYTTCMGHPENNGEGLYTSGQVDGSSQIFFTPLYNYFNHGVAPEPSRLSLPNSLTPNSIASCRNSDLSTDLYLQADSSETPGGLYYLPSNGQGDQSVATLLFSNVIFAGTKNLYAFTGGGNVVVWGLNGSNQVFYAMCPAGQQQTPEAWSNPVPIATGVDLISPYINNADNANVFFASDNENLYRLTQSPSTTIWAEDKITFPPPTNLPAVNFASYTTRLQYLDPNNQPLTSPLQLSASTRGSFVVNNLYYILDTTPVQVTPDVTGTITIIECANGINGTRLTVSETVADGVQININPMDKPMQKTFGLGSSTGSTTALQNAQITNPVTGVQTPLVGSGVSSQKVSTAAQGINSLQTCYSSFPGGSTATSSVRPTATLRLGDASEAGGFIDGIETAFGDVVNFLESGIDYVVNVVKDTASGLWYFVVTIGEAVYNAVLDCVEKVVGAAVWLFDQIEVAIKDLILFLEFLFEWQDITRTKEVFKNIVNLFIQNQVSELSSLQAQFDQEIQTLINEINNWAGVTNWSSNLGQANSNPLSGSSNPSSGSASGSLLSHHFQNNASNLQQTNPPAPPNPTDGLIQNLFNAISEEADTLGAAYSALQGLAEQMPPPSLGDLLQQIVAILADTTLASAQTVVDAIFAIVEALAQTALDVLTTPVYIPVVSDILSYFGVSMPSMLDVFCWVAAVPFTLAYKIVKDAAPFPDDANTEFLINATSWSDLKQAFGITTSAPTLAPQLDTRPTVVEAATNSSVSIPQLPQSVQEVIFGLGHSAAFVFGLIGAFIDVVEAGEESGDNPFAIPAAILAILAGGGAGSADVLAPQYPLQQTAVVWVYRAAVAVRAIFKLIYSGPAQKRFATSTGILNGLAASDGRATGAIIDSIIAIPQLACSCYHFYELSNDPAGDERSNAIIEETANMTCYVSRVAYAIAVNTQGTPKAVSIGVMGVAEVAYGGLEFAETEIGFAT